MRTPCGQRSQAWTHTHTQASKNHHKNSITSSYRLDPYTTLNALDRGRFGADRRLAEVIKNSFSLHKLEQPLPPPAFQKHGVRDTKAWTGRQVKAASPPTHTQGTRVFYTPHQGSKALLCLHFLLPRDRPTKHKGLSVTPADPKPASCLLLFHKPTRPQEPEQGWQSPTSRVTNQTYLSLARGQIFQVTSDGFRSSVK